MAVWESHLFCTVCLWYLVFSKGRVWKSLHGTFSLLTSVVPHLTACCSCFPEVQQGAPAYWRPSHPACTPLFALCLPSLPDSHTVEPVSWRSSLFLSQGPLLFFLILFSLSHKYWGVSRLCYLPFPLRPSDMLINSATLVIYILLVQQCFSDMSLTVTWTNLNDCPSCMWDTAKALAVQSLLNSTWTQPNSFSPAVLRATYVYCCMVELC